MSEEIISCKYCNHKPVINNYKTNHREETIIRCKNRSDSNCIINFVDGITEDETIVLWNNNQMMEVQQ